VKPTSRIAWHYTSGERATEILSAGELKGADDESQGAPPAPVLFSLRQHWDPIANADEHAADGSARKPSFEQGTAPSDGAWRFGIAADELISWRQLAAGMDRDAARALERAGRKAGSDPALWLASRDPVKLDRCRIEHLHGDHWCSADHDD
jgi:hypothetical protein